MLKSKLSDSTKELAFQNEEKEKRAAELIIANKELVFQNKEKEKRAAELSIANKELAFQNEEKEKRAAELIIANKELVFQNGEKEQRAAELIIANKELIFQNGEKEQRAAELIIANEELVFQNKEKEKRAAELSIANKELAFQNKEKEKRAAELSIANKELAFQNEEKEKRAAELSIANKELAFQNEEKEKRAAELNIANKELAFQNEEKEKRAAELNIANKELAFQNEEKEKRAAELILVNYARSLLEASLDPLVTISADGKITDVNEASIKITGVEREKLIDTDFSNYFTEPQKAQKGYQQVFKKGFVADYPLTIKHKNGNLTDVLYNASVYKDDKGNVLGVFAAARDITARKKAEEKIKESELEVRKIKEQLELSITAGKIGVWHWDVKKDLLYWSKEQHEIYGFNKSETVTNSDQFNALIVSEDLKRIQDDQRAGHKVEHEYDFQINRKNDGELRWVKSRAKSTFDTQGILQYISGVNIDITEQKLFEGRLIEAKTLAENAAKSRQQFLSNMSHEIRTPLNSILGFTNVLLKTELGLQQKEFLAAIDVSGKSLNLIVNDILDLAKVDAGKMTFVKKPIKIRKSINSIVHSFEMKIKEKNLELLVEHDSKVPSVLLCDSLRLNQIFFNLLSNAVKFTHSGIIKLTIQLLHEDTENVTIEFVVSDSGIGIADNKLNSIFNLFEQAEINPSALYGGTGLGLSIVKQLVEGQGGSISVKSKLGEGSAFSFILPFGKTKLKLENEITLTKPNLRIKTLRVLVAEDVALNQLLIKILLNEFGFKYEIVGNGKLAIEKMQTNAYDIILMDLQMPEMNGYEATEYIRKTLKSHIPIIALTADVTSIDVSKCKEFGMDDYVSKPINEDLLYQKIVELVNSQQ
jgi:PAS domain S-box-containing protein